MLILVWLKGRAGHVNISISKKGERDMLILECLMRESGVC